MNEPHMTMTTQTTAAAIWDEVCEAVRAVNVDGYLLLDPSMRERQRQAAVAVIEKHLAGVMTQVRETRELQAIIADMEKRISALEKLPEAQAMEFNRLVLENAARAVDQYNAAPHRDK